MLAYDGQSATAQAAHRAALAAVAAKIALLLTAPGSTASAALAQDLPKLLAVLPDDASGYATALTTLLEDYVAGVVTDINAPPGVAPADGFAYVSRLADLPGDPSQGIAGLAAVSSSLAAPSSGIAASNFAALMQLVEGSATTALQMLYAQTDFASADDADQAREQLRGLIVEQLEAAQGNDPLVQAWRGALTAAIIDLTQRAKALPDVAIATMPAPMPALWMAQFLYQDGTEAPVLVQRNRAPHPLFMPRDVEYLAA